MNRRIDMTYELNDDKTLVTINLVDESNNNVTKHIKEYDLMKIDEIGILYNQMLDDFGAEYDDELADTIDRIVNKIEKEVLMMNKKIVHRTKNVITIDDDSAKKYIELTTKINKLKKELEPIEKQLKSELMDVMETLDTTNVKSNGIVASLTRAYVQNKLDTTRLKEENIVLYNQYLKPTNVSASLKLSIEK